MFCTTIISGMHFEHLRESCLSFRHVYYCLKISKARLSLLGSLGLMVCLIGCVAVVYNLNL